jgi:hypothetical protein
MIKNYRTLHAATVLYNAPANQERDDGNRIRKDSESMERDITADEMILTFTMKVETEIKKKIIGRDCLSESLVHWIVPMDVKGAIINLSVKNRA